MKLRKLIALLLCALMIVPAVGGAESASWTYSFAAGDILEGDSMAAIREALDALAIELKMDRTEERNMGQAALISYGKPVLTLRAAVSGDQEDLGLYCSLLGDCTLMCRQDQVEDFLLKLVQMLGERSLLKQDSLAQAESLAKRASGMILEVISRSDQVDPTLGLDLDFYLARLETTREPAERIVLDGTDPECPGAAQKEVWTLSEEELNELVDSLISKILKIPFLGTAFVQGSLKIGSQEFSESFVRKVVSSMHGETTLAGFSDAEGRAMKILLYTPDLSGVITDPVFGKMQGLELSVEDTAENVRETRVRLLGLEGSLLTMRMEKGAGDPLDPLPTRSVYQVGEMDSAQLWDLIQSLGLTIAANALNLVMDLPRIVFDTLINKLF